MMERGCSEGRGLGGWLNWHSEGRTLGTLAGGSPDTEMEESGHMVGGWESEM